MLQAETLPRSIQNHCTWLRRILGFKRTASNMQLVLNAKLYITLTNAFITNQMVKLCRPSAVMLIFLISQRKQVDEHVEWSFWKPWGQELENYSCILNKYTASKKLDSLQDLMTNPERDLDCSAQLPENVLGECFEGRVWKEFQYVDGEPFLAAPLITLVSCRLVSAHYSQLRLCKCYLPGSHEPSKGRTF